jgi:hypothetical protein
MLSRGLTQPDGFMLEHQSKTSKDSHPGQTGHGQGTRIEIQSARAAEEGNLGEYNTG